MSKANGEVAVIPSDYFHWRPRVQFIGSFPKRAEAVRYARRHGCNLVVESNEANGPQFDVLTDPGLPCKPAFNLGLFDFWKALRAFAR